MRNKKSLSRLTVNPGATKVKPTASAKPEEEEVNNYRYFSS